MSSIGPVVTEEKMFENVDGRRTDAGRRSHWYTISSPMSLRLRWAKKVIFKHGHVAYQIDKDEEQNKMQVKFSY